ncbi:MAG: VacJ family lipoprotein [Deltaproteobacteria bacterium]|nr:VacJ family lipoprotein [Candidatus Anaeroferrophillacea bacterium]
MKIRRLAVWGLLAVMLMVGGVRGVPAAAAPADGAATNALNDEYADTGPTIVDPLEGFNRAMFTFNDRLYFWVLKPAAQGYSLAVPEPARIGIRNFFHNLLAPVRIVNCLLQGRIGDGGEEFCRLLLNSTVGCGGLMDPASYDGMAGYDEDFDQTLGVHGLGQGAYIVWPVFGPCSARGTVGLAGDMALSPLTWVFWNDYETGMAVKAGQTINETSLVIGDYEDLIRAVIDPYVAVRDAYVQRRQTLVEQ